MNEAQVRVRYDHQPDSDSNEVYDCLVGNHVRLDVQLIQDYSAKPLRPVEYDLILLAGAIAYTDRKIRRRRGSGWRRTLDVTIPVSDPELWSEKRILIPLLDILHYVTGDQWSIHFVDGARPITSGQSTLDFSELSDAVVPFSDGLDSYLQWRLLADNGTHGTPLRVHTNSRASDRKRSRAIDLQGRRDGVRLSLPVSLRVGKHPEPSFRTRTLLFFVLAALAAVKVGIPRVVVGENGVGSLGPSILPYGDEHPHRTTHPGFTRRLAQFINRLLCSNVTFEHPQLFRTKGAVLREAIRHGINGWQFTRSCVRGPRDRIGTDHCGLCSGCLLRRAALHHVGVRDSKYFWDDLSGPKLDDCRRSDSGRLATQNDLSIASHAIHGMNAMAGLASSTINDASIRQAAWDLIGPEVGKIDETGKAILHLIRAHATEWSAFRSQFSSAGLIR